MQPIVAVGEDRQLQGPLPTSRRRGKEVTLHLCTALQLEAELLGETRTLAVRHVDFWTAPIFVQTSERSNTSSRHCSRHLGSLNVQFHHVPPCSISSHLPILGEHPCSRPPRIAPPRTRSQLRESEKPGFQTVSGLLVGGSTTGGAGQHLARSKATWVAT